MTLIKQKILLITKKFEKKVREATSKLALLKAEPKKRWHLLHNAEKRLAEEKQDLALTKKTWAKRLEEDKEENARVMRAEKDMIASGQKAKEIFKLCSKTKSIKFNKSFIKAANRLSATVRKLDKTELMDPKRHELLMLKLKYSRMKVYYIVMKLRCRHNIVEDWKLLDEIPAPAICKPETRAQCIRKNVKLIKKFRSKYFIAEQALRSSQQENPNLPTYAKEHKIRIFSSKVAKKQQALKECKDTICADVQKIVVSTKQLVPKKKTVKCAPGYGFNGFSCKL